MAKLIDNPWQNDVIILEDVDSIVQFCRKKSNHRQFLFKPFQPPSFKKHWNEKQDFFFFDQVEGKN